TLAERVVVVIERNLVLDTGLPRQADIRIVRSFDGRRLMAGVEGRTPGREVGVEIGTSLQPLVVHARITAVKPELVADHRTANGRIDRVDRLRAVGIAQSDSAKGVGHVVRREKVLAGVVRKELSVKRVASILRDQIDANAAGL